MTSYRSAFWVNGLCLLLLIPLILYAKFSASISVDWLFMPPVSPEHPSYRLLTYTFQILCTVPAMVCAFTWGLLRVIQPGNKQNSFILCSALITIGFLLNEIFRIHIVLLELGIPKLVTIIVYAIVLVCYGLAFKRQLKSTPYPLLLAGLGLLFSAIAVDSLHLRSNTTVSLLEGVPKLFSEINIALYYWYICHREVLRSLTATPKS